MQKIEVENLHTLEEAINVFMSKSTKFFSLEKCLEKILKDYIKANITKSEEELKNES